MRLFLTFLLFWLLVPTVVAQVEITEIMYAPEDPPFDYHYNEWIEIYSDVEVDLSNYTLCGTTLVEGFVDLNGTVHNENSLTLSAGQYAIITDGGSSGTEVYDNFDVDSNALSISAKTATLCNSGLNNGGETITIEDESSAIVEEVTYDTSLGAGGDGNSLQLADGEWRACLPTPGSSNDCPEEVVEEEPQEDLEDVDQEEEEVEGKIETAEDEPDEEIEVEITGDGEFIEDDTEAEVVYPKSTLQENSAGEPDTESVADNSQQETEKVYSASSGNIKIAVFLLLSVSVLLNVIFIAFRR